MVNPLFKTFNIYLSTGNKKKKNSNYIVSEKNNYLITHDNMYIKFSI